MGLTVTEAARRNQIVNATIETLAELGYTKTSFARIVERAGLSSTRMISYHFKGKADLMNAVMGTLVDALDSFVGERTAPGTDRTAMLRSYIHAELAFLRDHPDQMRALVEIATGMREEGGSPISEMVLQDLRTGRLERQLRQGQQEGALGTFDPAVMAMAIRQALDGVAGLLGRDPDLDVDTYAGELADLFERATAG
jgi:AcrR family transcriptional regulator